MNKMRLLFSKTNRAKYISHLDLMRTTRRAFARAGIELRYSEGFNPHPYISVALPLSVGCESVCELLDFQPAGDKIPDDLPEILSREFPEGILVTKAYAPFDNFNKIAWLEVRGRFFYDNGVPAGFENELAQRFDCADSLTVRKKTKRGISELDVKPFIKSTGFYRAADNEIIVSARLSAREPTITTNDLQNAVNLCGGAIKPDFASFKRIEIYDAEHNVFR